MTLPAVVPRSLRELDGTGKGHEKEEFNRERIKRETRIRRFLIDTQNKAFTRQYAHVYFQRLKCIRPRVVRQARNRLGTNVQLITRLIDMSIGHSAGVAIGTIYKHQPLRPSVLNEFVEEFDGRLHEALPDNFCSPDDTLFLEDESGRIELTDLQPSLVNCLVTGVIVGVLGRLLSNGRFSVEDVVLPGLPPQPNVIKNGIANSVKNRYLLLVSGLNVGTTEPLKLDLLLEYVTGQLGNKTEHTLQAEIVHVIVAGGSVTEPAKDVSRHSARGNQSRMRKTMNRYAGPVNTLDETLMQICGSVQLDIMPGKSDPCNITMPLQPLHPCLLPHCSRYSDSFKCVSNPYECTLQFENNDGLCETPIVVLGTSGEPISDMMKYTTGLKPLDLLESTLSWSHVCPNAPDTLPCYPFHMHEPFVLEELPHLYFAGNMPSFDTKVIQGSEESSFCRLVCVPEFARSGSVVLVNLSTENLECSTLQFTGLC